MRFPTGYCGAQVKVSAHTGRIYLLRSGFGDGELWPIDTRLTVLDGRTGQVLKDTSVSAELGLHGGGAICAALSLALLTAPGAPLNLRANVNGSTVTLSWTNVGDASGFVLDVGLAPGHTTTSVFIGPASTVTFANIPTGTYYVRVRGGNEFGGGHPSAGIAVVVP